MKSNKRNYRRNKNRKTKRNETKGGKVIGKGSDGVILHPSYFVNENTVAKVFIGRNNRDGESNSANYEMEANRMLQKTLNLKILLECFVLPIKLVSMNKSHLSSEDKLQLSDVFDELPTPIWMIIYPQGEMSAYVYLNRNDDINLFLKMYENVAYAVKIMQYHDIVHRDFKLDNVLFIHDTFKIADITFLSRIEDINSNSEYLGISRYYPFPSIYGFTLLFEYPQNYTRGILDPQLLYDINSQLNNNEFKKQTEYSTRLFNDYISLFGEISFERNEAIILQSYHFNLTTYYDIENLSKLLHTKYSNNLRRFKTYLFLTIDTYSFGMSLMKVAVRYFINHKTSNRTLLNKLHSIIFKCCEFSVKIKVFDEIYTMYRDMLA